MFAVEVLYWGAKQHDDHDGPGTTFAAAAASLKEWGQPDEALWPYDPLRNESDATYRPPEAAIDPAVCMFADLRRVAATADAVRAELDENRVVAIGGPTWPGLRRPRGDRINNPTKSELDGGHHAMAVVGYRMETGEFLVRNSWGLSWGDEGHAWVPMGFVDDHVREAWIVAASQAQPTATVSLAGETLFGDGDETTT